MDQHLKVLGILHIVYGAIGICTAFLLFAFVVAGGLISGDSDALIATSLVATLAGFFFLLVFLPGGDRWRIPAAPSVLGPDPTHHRGGVESAHSADRDCSWHLHDLGAIKAGSDA
jgi:hypothetical protein